MAISFDMLSRPTFGTAGVKKPATREEITQQGLGRDPNVINARRGVGVRAMDRRPDMGSLDLGVRAALEERPGLSLQQAQEVAARKGEQEHYAQGMAGEMHQAQLAQMRAQTGALQRQTQGSSGSSAASSMAQRAAERGLRQSAAQSSEDSNLAFERQKELLGLQGQQATTLAKTQAQLQAEAEQRKFSRFQEFLKTLPPIDGGGGEFSLPGGPDPQEEAARAAAFSRSRDQAGRIGASAMRGLQEAMAGRGVMGSTMEAAGAGNILGQTGSLLGEVSREQAVSGAARAAQIADRNLQAKLQKRQQDIARQQALMSLFGGSF